jgi:2,4-dienoyl-CoA reductase-like NADH-dependent reductase (Old Yellow Enzyme family)
MKNVFESWSLGTLRLKSRVIRSATHEGMTHPDGMPTDDLVKTYERLAAGGAGAIITGYVGVKGNGRTFSKGSRRDESRSECIPHSLLRG